MLQGGDVVFGQLMPAEGVHSGTPSLRAALHFEEIYQATNNMNFAL